MFISVKDQIGHLVRLRQRPKRIISVVPSQTELLYDLGLRDEVVGITKFCIHPEEWFKTKTKVGGTKNLKLDVIKQLQPDLIIANKEENTRTDIIALQQEFPVWTSDIFSLDDAMRTITTIGALTEREPEADYLNHLIIAGFRDIAMLASTYAFKGKKVAYLIWRNPYMAAGTDTYINDIISRIGLENAVQQVRYPELTAGALQQIAPHYVFLSSEPYPFKEKHIEELEQLLPKAQIMLVDGEMFSWYGSRLVKAVQYFFNFQKKISKDNRLDY